MRIFPKNIDEWPAFVFFPFKAYTVIAPVMIWISLSLPRPRNVGSTDADAYMALGLLACAGFQMAFALLLALTSQKRLAWSCLWFGLGGAFVTALMLPHLANARA
jgi:hypothetical protein